MLSCTTVVRCLRSGAWFACAAMVERQGERTAWLLIRHRTLHKGKQIVELRGTEDFSGGQERPPTIAVPTGTKDDYWRLCHQHIVPIDRRQPAATG